jgi:aminomethyltransferase
MIENGVQPCGLGARDTLRLEAGYLLSGLDFDENRNPIEATLGWACKEDREVVPVGGEAVAKMRGMKESRRMMGIIMNDRGIPRHDAYLSLGPMTISIGYVTSGTFSPTLDKGIGLALLSSDYKKPGTELQLKMRGKGWPVTVVRPPFVKDTSIRK